jgi:nucleotidyltransferase substrate binding protein (TIGR01987 family)
MEDFQKALLKINEIIQLEPNKIIWDAVIHRFEFTFELAWKSLKSFLKEYHEIICNSPKSCLREAFRLELLNERETEDFLLMVEDRNSTTHIYSENISNKIFENIKAKYYTHLKLLYERISK